MNAVSSSATGAYLGALASPTGALLLGLLFGAAAVTVLRRHQSHPAAPTLLIGVVLLALAQGIGVGSVAAALAISGL